MALAAALEFPIRGLRSKVTKFLDDQVRRCPPGGTIPNPDPEDAGSPFPGSSKWGPSVESIFLSPVQVMGCILLASLSCHSVFVFAHPLRDSEVPYRNHNLLAGPS